jgi:anti-anti-sigma factor
MDQPQDTLTLSNRRSGSVEIVSLEGEFDLDGMGPFQRTVGDVLAERPSAIDIDAREVACIDSSGLRALLLARQQAEAAGIELRLVRTSVELDRMLAMTGPPA